MASDWQLPVKLSCICGACQLSLHAPPLMVYLCHCLSCQRVSGSDYCHNARFDPGQVHVDRGQDRLVAFQKESSLRQYHYCSTCHVRVITKLLQADDPSCIARMVVPVGLATSRDGAEFPAWQPEDGHAWYPERARDISDNRPKWEGFCGESSLLQSDAPSSAQPELQPQPPPPTTVTCRCGNTQLEASAPPLAICYCHCTSCRQLTGSDFAHNAQFAPEQVRVVKGEDGLLQYCKPGSRRITFRCGRCFGRMYRELQDDSGAVFLKVVPVGLVDKAAGAVDPAWQPQFHIWWSERAVQDLQDNLPKWAGDKDESPQLM